MDANALDTFERDRRDKVGRFGGNPDELLPGGGYRYTMGNHGDITDQASRSPDGKHVDVYYFSGLAFEKRRF